MEDESIAAVLRRAARVVDLSEVAEDLRTPAFTAAVGFIKAESQVGMSSDSGGARTNVATEVVANPPAGSSLERIRSRLGVDEAVISRVYADAMGALQIIVAPSRLAASRRAAMRELALAFVVGRQTGGWDTTATALTLTRGVCEGYGPKFFDPNNFMNAINDLGDELRKVPDAKEIRLLLTPPGIEAGRALVQRLGTTEST